MTGRVGGISTGKIKKISLAFGAETASLRDPLSDQSPGRRHPKPQVFSLAVATREREPPNKADRRRHRPGRSHPTLPTLLRLLAPRPESRRRFASYGRGKAL